MSGNWLADMQVLLSEMQKSCSRCNVFASRAANPACRPAIFSSRPDAFASRAATPACRPAIFTSRPGPFTIVLFYYFISIRFQAGGSCISGRKTCMSARHFHQSAGPFIILLLHLYWVPGSRLLHLEPQNLHVGPPFSPVDWTVYYFTILLYSTSIRFQAGGFSISGRKTCMSARHFSPVGRAVYYFTLSLFRFHSVPGKCLLHLGLPILYARRSLVHLLDFFCISGRQPGMSAQDFCMWAKCIPHSIGNRIILNLAKCPCTWTLWSTCISK